MPNFERFVFRKQLLFWDGDGQLFINKRRARRAYKKMLQG